MPTALAEWTTERPEEPGFYWWRDPAASQVEVVELYRTALPNGSESWEWYVCGDDVGYDETKERPDALWWPVRLDPPPVG